MNRAKLPSERLFHFVTREGKFFRTAYSPAQAKDLYVIDCLSTDKVVTAVETKNIDFTTYTKSAK